MFRHSTIFPLTFAGSSAPAVQTSAAATVDPAAAAVAASTSGVSGRPLPIDAPLTA